MDVHTLEGNASAARLCIVELGGVAGPIVLIAVRRLASVSGSVPVASEEALPVAPSVITALTWARFAGPVDIA